MIKFCMGDHQLNSNFTSNIINAFGAKGKKWLEELPDVISNLAEIWALTNICPVDNLSWNYVAIAVCNNQEVALKISYEKEVIFDEMSCLKYWDALGSIKLLDFKEAYNAMLLEKANPGISLKYSDMPFEAKVQVYVNSVRALERDHLPDTKFTHVAKILRTIDRIRDNRLPLAIISKAKQIQQDLLDSSDQEYLCHGDLHMDNILQHNQSWLVIDPKAIIAPEGFELAACDIIDKNEKIKDQDRQAIILDRIRMIAGLAEVEFEYLVKWVFCRCIISAQWFIEDGGDPDFMIKLTKDLYAYLVGSE